MANFKVTNTNDSGIGSLRRAIEYANATNGADIIILDSSLSGKTINLTSGEILITESLTIEGLGSDNLTIDAGGKSSVFVLGPGILAGSDIDFTVNDLIITGGVSDRGGGILVYESTLSDVNWSISTNSDSVTMVVDSVISDNIAIGNGVVISLISDNIAIGNGDVISENSDNIASGDAGSIILSATSPILINNPSNGGVISENSDNIASGNGDVISENSDNIASGDAGSITLSATSLTLTNNPSNGGVISENSDNIAIGNGNVISENSDNIASGNAGSITVSTPSLTLTKDDPSIPAENPPQDDPSIPSIPVNNLSKDDPSIPVNNPDITVLDDPLFRFRNEIVSGTYLFAGEQESQSIRSNFSPPFIEEGQAFKVSLEQNDDLVLFNRFRNNQVQGYLYATEEESVSIRENFSDVFTEEGTAFYTFGADANMGQDVIRFRNKNVSGTYLFVLGEEANSIRENFSDVFEEEGVAFEVAV